MTTYAIILLTLLTIPSQGLEADSLPKFRIVGGENVTIEHFPYQVSISFNGIHKCGGSIINEYFILTAAHCLRYEIQHFTVRAGSSINNEDGIVRQIVEKFCHPQYNYLTYDYDICILKLDHLLPFNEKIAPIRLPKQNKRNDSVDNLVGTATGWGKLQPGGDSPKQLQMVKLPIWPQDECKRIMSELGFVITDRMFCAGYHEGGKDTCQGDSGGSMVADGVLIGITSFGGKCGFKENSGAYVRVSYFVDYINSIISNI